MPEDNRPEGPTHHGRALAWPIGVAMAAVCLFFALFLLAQGEENARRASCLANMAGLSKSLGNYSVDYDGRMPLAGEGILGTWTYGGNQSPNVDLCPSDRRAAKQEAKGRPTSYTLNAALSGIYPGDLVGSVPALFDGNQLSGGPEAAEYRHRTGWDATRINVFFLGGWELKSLSRSEFEALRFEPVLSGEARGKHEAGTR